MGTVGISFGSPTAGTGFDVTSTVNQIVANLQNVEIPWKTQLTTLQSEDTAISSLGTLLSTVSTDIANLTDFQGVLATKQGSSSDTNVIALTSASSSAIAGTHSIVVNSLAATSSGNLTEITNASDTLSGSITIEVGSGTAQTLTIGSSSNTLATLASTINSGNYGVTASVLSDANGSRLSLVSNSSGAGGNITATSTITDSTTSSALAYTTAITGVNASINVDGTAISTASNTVSTVIPGVTFQLLAPSPVTSGTAESVQVQILNDNTDVVTAVNQLVTDYNAVVKAVNTQETSSTTGANPPLFGTPTLSLLQEQLLGAVNATSPAGYVDAISTASDTLSGSISIASGSGTATTFNLSTLASGSQDLAGLASAINAANIGVNASVIKDPAGLSRLSLSATNLLQTNDLTVTSALTDATTSTALAWNPGSSVTGLSALGITQNDDGTLSLNQTTLNSELNSNYSGVIAFFQNNYSWGATFTNSINGLGSSSSTDELSLALASDSSTETDLNQDITNEQTYITAQQTELTNELNQANETLQAIPANLNNISELYSAITGYQAPTF